MSRPGESEKQKLITCNRCGKLTYEGFGSCQYCGALFSGKSGSGVDSKTGAPEQPQLPAWLESLRDGERPAESSSEQFNYTSNGSADKDALPSWMLPESAEHISAEQRAVRRSASLPAPNTDDGFAGGITASSLIDEQYLPSWMRENQSAADLSAQRNISAASLVQSDAPPEWMRNAQQPTSPVAPATPLQYAEPVIPPQGIAANSLVDPQAMPTWIAGQSGSNQPPPTGGSIAAGSLLDMSALPNWLREHGQEQKPVKVEINPAARSGQIAGTNASVAAPSLIDVNALPEWLRPGAEQGQGGATPAASAARSFNVPPRVENVRVPSRPRGEMGSREQSEAAANVFASMLGVASPVPNFPPQMPGNPSPQGQPRMGGVGPSGSAGSAPTSSYAAGSAGYQEYQGGSHERIDTRSASYAEGSYMLGVQQPGVHQQQPAMAMNRQMEPSTKAVKRGFLETIRGWFSR